MQKRGSSEESPQSLTASQKLLSEMHLPLVQRNSESRHGEGVVGGVVWKPRMTGSSTTDVTSASVDTMQELRGCR